MGKAPTLSDISPAVPPGQRQMDKFLELTEDAVSAMLSAGDGSTSPMRNQKGISHKEVHFVFKSSSHPKNPLKPQGTG